MLFLACYGVITCVVSPFRSVVHWNYICAFTYVCVLVKDCYKSAGAVGNVSTPLD